MLTIDGRSSCNAIASTPNLPPLTLTVVLWMPTGSSEVAVPGEAMGWLSTGWLGAVCCPPQAVNPPIANASAPIRAAVMLRLLPFTASPPIAAAPPMAPGQDACQRETARRQDGK
jgi:hypothetical protein